MSFLDFEEDVYNELKKSSALPHLDPALRLAAAQLEFLKPAAMLPTNNGIWSGPVAAVDRGALHAVMANTRQVVTSHMMPLRQAEFLTAIEDGVAHLDLGCGDRGAKVSALIAAVKNFGGKPGKASPKVDPDLCNTQFAVV